jgi:hypothetical protein
MAYYLRPQFFYFKFNQVGYLITRSHLQLRPDQDKAKQLDTCNNREVRQYIGHGGKVITIWQLNTGMVECAEYEYASRDTGVQRSKINTYSMGMR